LSGAIDIAGPLGRPEGLTVDATVNDATLTLLDYDLRNDGPIHLSYKDDQFLVQQLRLSGKDTRLQLTGSADAREKLWHLSTDGAASLSILQAFFPGITSSGAATLNATLTGTFDEPKLTGDATISDGRLRPLTSIHSLEAINGTIRFDETGVNVDGLRGTIGNGLVTFGGNISVDGYRLSQFNLTAQGRSMGLRYPVGFRSTVDMDLYLTGPIAAPRLTGSVDVLRVSLTSSIGDPGLLAIAALGGADTASPVGQSAPASGSGAIALDIQVNAPRTTFVNTKTTRLEGIGDLRVTGTFDRPSIIGTIDILGGEATSYGNRYFIRESSIEFRNPARVEPVFDLTADTRAHVQGDTYDINVHLSGTFNQLSYSLTSEPALPETDIIAILLGGLPDVSTANERALRSPQEAQQRVMQSAMANIVTDLISTRIGDVAERALALDTVQITPLLPGDAPLQQLNPTARVTLGKRISPRVFLTYSRSLTGPQDEVILLEYDQNDRVSWVLSRNENRTYALDFRIRYVH
jgi:translocation and assembly module TamB